MNKTTASAMVLWSQGCFSRVARDRATRKKKDEGTGGRSERGGRERASEREKKREK